MPSAPPPSRSPEPDALDDDERGSFVLRFGTGVGAGALAAAVAAIPASMRTASALASGPGAASAWTACVALAMLPMIVAVVVLRGARVGLRALGGPDAAARSIGVAFWLFTLFVFEALFGSMLRATTHHHALAGTTFAVVSVGVAVVLAVLSMRLSAIIATRSAALRRSLLVGSSGLLVLAMLVAGLRFARAFGGGDASGSTPGALVVDLLAFGIAALFASRPSFTHRRALALAGPPIAAALFAVGLWSLRGSNALADATVAHAPVLSPFAGLFGGH